MPSAQWSLWINVIVLHIKHSWVYNLFAWNKNISIIYQYMRLVKFNNLKIDKGTRTGNEQRNNIRKKRTRKDYISIITTMSKYIRYPYFVIEFAHFGTSNNLAGCIQTYNFAHIFSWDIYWTQYSNACPLFPVYWSQFRQLTAVNDISRIFLYQIDLWRGDLRYRWTWCYNCAH